MLYLTDTGRCWNDERYSVRDKVDQGFIFNLKKTADIISTIFNNRLPEKIMITTHPQRWTNNSIAWIKELVLQKIKNSIKRYFFVR